MRPLGGFVVALFAIGFFSSVATRLLELACVHLRFLSR